MSLLEQELLKLNWDINDYPNLAKSFDMSEARIEQARDDLLARLGTGGRDVDVVAFGSLARREMTDESDLDYLVLNYDENAQDGEETLADVDTLRATLGDGGIEIRRPGATGVFGQLIPAVDLYNVIGLEGDSNHSHTRRILFLEESVSLFAPVKHSELLGCILQKYLDAKPPGTTQIPRYMLNDMERYWRTLTIDYQAKTSINGGTYSLRYLKLIVSRKFTYAASILPLLLLHGDSRFGANDPDGALLIAELKELYLLPPIIRYLRACGVLLSNNREGGLEVSLKRVFNIVEEFNGLLGSGDWRRGIEAECQQPDVKSQPLFSQGRTLGRDLQEELERIFFHDVLATPTRKYLIF